MIEGIVESALYVADLGRAMQFYRDVLGLEVMSEDERLVALSVGGRQVLLLFKRGASLQPMTAAGGTIPPHDGSGPVHIGFSIAVADLPAWEQRLAAHGVTIESRVQWERGGTSLYFRDPDAHAVELLTPGVWPIY